MSFRTGIELSSLKLCRRSTSGSDDGITKRLSVMIQVLTIAENAAGATTIPGLKGAIGIVLSIMKCVQVGDPRSIICELP